MTTLKEFQEEMQQDLYSMTKADAVDQGICIDCKQPALPNCYSSAGRREYYISGLCEKCFDKLFMED